MLQAQVLLAEAGPSADKTPLQAKKERVMTNHVDNKKFLAWLTLALILATLWIFKS